MTCAAENNRAAAVSPPVSGWLARVSGASGVGYVYAAERREGGAMVWGLKFQQDGAALFPSCYDAKSAAAECVEGFACCQSSSVGAQVALIPIRAAAGHSGGGVWYWAGCGWRKADESDLEDLRRGEQWTREILAKSRKALQGGAP